MSQPKVNGNGSLDHMVDARTPLDALLARECGQVLDASLEALEPRERVILRGRFFESRTLKDLGHGIGISPGRVLQVQNRALRRLAHPIRNLARFLEA